jgi:hypothetical protein
LCNFTEAHILQPYAGFSSEVGLQSAYIVGESNLIGKFINYEAFSAMGCVVLLFGYIHVTLWTITSERQTFQMRQAVFRLLINKNIAYFDSHNVGQINTILIE